MKTYLGQVLEGSTAQKLLSWSNWSMSCSGHLDVFANPGALQTLYFWGFYGGSVTQVPWMISSTPSSSPPSGE